MNLKKKFSRQRIFNVMAVLLPFLVLILIEFILRASNFGYNTNLFVEDKTGRYYYLNPEISRKYFTVEQNATKGNLELFTKRKSPGTIRYFVLGESSSVGFPYMHNGAFPRMLKYRLQFAYPGVNFEIINLSLTAINSYTLYDFSKQLVGYEPDGIIIYAGHNEYYGALGVASSSSLGRSTGLVRGMMALKEFKLGQLIFKVAAKIKGTDKKTTDYSLTLMERMAHDQSIPYNSKLYQQGIHQFDANMSDMLRVFNKHQIPVFISNIVYNQKDLKPFISNTGKFNANREYHSGNRSYEEGIYLSAKKHYTLAKEYDGLRFRAPEMMNSLIKKYARIDPNVHFVNVVHEFEINSPHAILDSTLLLEHVHPNLRGQQLISNAFYNEIIKSGKLSHLKKSAFAFSITAGNYPLTSFDTIYGQISIWLLKEQWPYNQPIPAEEPGYVRSYEEQIAGACAVKQVNWFDSMTALYNYYKQKQDLPNALRVMEGLCLEFPYDAEYFLLAGKLSLLLHEEKKALFYLSRANVMAPSGEAQSLLVMVQNHQLSMN